MKKSRASNLRVGGALLLLLVVALLILGSFPAKPPVELTLKDCQISKTSFDDSWELPELSATLTIAATNLSDGPITYYGYSRTFPIYSVVQPSLFELKASDGFWCGFGLDQYTLAPGEGIVFDAGAFAGDRCKIRLHYSDGKPPSRIRQRIPDWMADYLPASWTDGPSATTDTIDLRPGSHLLNDRPQSDS